MPERLVVRRAGAEQSNSSVLFDEYGDAQALPAAGAGGAPEIEMARFLVERAGFANTPPLLGHDRDARSTARARPQTMALGVLFGFVRNQGDGWTLALNYLHALSRRRAERGRARRGAAATRPANCPTPITSFSALARQLGLRTGEMHRALAEHGGDDPDFAPEPITPRRHRAVARRIAGSAPRTCSRGSRASRDRLPERGARARRSGARRARRGCWRRSAQLPPEKIAAVKTPLSRRLSPRPGASPCRTISTSSISRASRRARWPSAGARIRRCATSPG